MSATGAYRYDKTHQRALQELDVLLPEGARRLTRAFRCLPSCVKAQLELKKRGAGPFLTGSPFAEPVVVRLRASLRDLVGAALIRALGLVLRAVVTDSTAGSSTGQTVPVHKVTCYPARSSPAEAARVGTARDGPQGNADAGPDPLSFFHRMLPLVIEAVRCLIAI
jgi:hypothetical protein